MKLQATIAVAGEINKNGISFTKEALKNSVEQIKSLPFGVLFESTVSRTGASLRDAAFLVDDASMKDKQLQVHISPLPNTPGGDKLIRLVEAEGLTILDKYSVGMCATVGDDDVEKLEDGTCVVKKFKCNRVSFLRTEDKA